MQRIIAGVTGLLLGLAVPSPVLAGFCGLPDDAAVVIVSHSTYDNQWNGYSPYFIGDYYDEALKAYASVAIRDSGFRARNQLYEDLVAGRIPKPTPYCTFTQHYVPPTGGRTVIKNFTSYRLESDVVTSINPQEEARDHHRELSFDIPYKLAAQPAPRPPAPAVDPAWPQTPEYEDPEWTQIEEEIEDAFWEVVECDSPGQVQAYLQTYPQGRYVAQARACLAQQGQQAQQPTPSLYGALAIDSNQGASWGWAINHPTAQAGGRRALTECGDPCHIVMRFSNECAAFAADQAQGSTVYGWAHGYASGAGARNRATDECRKKGGTSCLVRAWGCTRQ